MLPEKGTFVSDGTDALDFVVAVGTANEYVEYVNDLMTDGSIADLDPINQLIMLEEMELHEAMQLMEDLYRTIKSQGNP